MMVRKASGFRLGRRLARLWRSSAQRLPQRKPAALAEGLIRWGRCLARRLRLRGGGNYCRLGRAAVADESEPATPKGHLAVYVDNGGGSKRYVVPVVHFNHPLFSELLREAEAEFGFDHPGGITIPCAVSRFERVRTYIAAARA